jgi:dipeptidyl aminopeptidase/acylaminoacyl peptidase
MVEQGTENVKQEPALLWSPDSSRIFTYRIDSRESEELYIVQAVPDEESVRPKLFRFVYPLPGEDTVPKAEQLIFEVNTGRRIPVNIAPQPVLYYGVAWPYPEWMEDSKSLLFVEPSRGWKEVTLKKIDATTGAVSTILGEQTEFSIFPNFVTFEPISDNSEVIWTSERDGWNHIYRFDLASGELVNKVTEGEWVVHYVADIDQEAGIIYFVAGGRETDRDPYYAHLYRVGLDGSDLTLLTPEDAEHSVSLSPDKKYFVDTYSRVNTAPVTALRTVRLRWNWRRLTSSCCSPRGGSGPSHSK